MFLNLVKQNDISLFPAKTTNSQLILLFALVSQSEQTTSLVLQPVLPLEVVVGPAQPRLLQIVPLCLCQQVAAHGHHEVTREEDVSDF